MATLVYSDADGRDRSFALGHEPVTVGRAVECAIRSEDPRVSRMHARFYVDQGTLWIEDLGSTHGIYVGPNKVQRSPVPIGEVILIGSLLIRLVPSTGTMPPPMGLHGTLATWLDLERKTRAAVEEERNAFAQRVGELHQVIAEQQAAADSVADAGATQPGMVGEAVRLRDEAEARAAALERALAAVQDELDLLRQGTRPDDDVARLRTELAAARDRVRELEADLSDRAEWSTVVGAEATNLERELVNVKSQLDEAQSASSNAEHAIAEASRESQTLRQELDHLRRASAADLEIARLELAKTREAKMMVEATAGIAVAEKLAGADLVIANLERELAEARSKLAAGPTTQQRESDELVATITSRAEKAEKELASAQIRAQGAERNLAHANAQAAKAEGRSAQLEQQVAEVAGRAKAGDEELAQARDRIAALETRAGAGDAPVQA
nr:FHA domain-containing protein [Myxococcota bacterium]